jgi:hypothetical protein
VTKFTTLAPLSLKLLSVNSLFMLCPDFRTQISYSILTPWSRVFLEKVTGFQLIKKFSAFHCSIHKCPPLVPILSQLDLVHTPTSHFLKIHLNIILPSTPGSPEWAFSLRFSYQNTVYASPRTQTRYIPRPSHSSLLCHQYSIG